MSRAGLSLLTVGVLLAGCPAEGSDDDDATEPRPTTVQVPLGLEPPDDLAELNLFTWDAATSSATFNDGVVPYDLNTPLFSDYASKERAIYVPQGETMGYDANEAFTFPVGSLILKNFLLPEDMRSPDENVRLIETRLLIKQEAEWEQWPYVWEADGSEASLDLGGEVFATSFIDTEGETVDFTYLVPQRNQCAECHELADEAAEDGRFITPIGPKARHLNRDYDYGDGPENQLEHFATLGMLSGLPALADVDVAVDESTLGPIDDLEGDALDEAARDYLDINCAHCHNPAGVNGISSQLFLNHDNESAFNLGVCKAPGSAGEGTGGFAYDIVPGNPAESILVFRMETQELGAMMPLLGRSLVHDEGVELVRRWVAQMEPDDCD
ncbi:MAG: hypothetical protein KDA24_28240 [Deltaproteobacteria bacterium]|nr:hypothetical protein [Deltaproteobacteria bacterium]